MTIRIDGEQIRAIVREEIAVAVKAFVERFERKGSLAVVADKDTPIFVEVQNGQHSPD